MRVKKKAKAFLAMKAAWDRSGKYCDPARTEDILGRAKNSLDLREEHGKTSECLNNPFQCWRSLLLPVVVVAMTCSVVGAKIFQKMWEGPCWEGVLALPGSMGRCAFAHIIQLLECPGEVRATQRAFLSRRNRWLSQKAAPLKPVVLAETLKACALVGLHLFGSRR